MIPVNIVTVFNIRIHINTSSCVAVLVQYKKLPCFGLLQKKIKAQNEVAYYARPALQTRANRATFITGYFMSRSKI